jgi:hypothetical protein
MRKLAFSSSPARGAVSAARHVLSKHGRRL